MPGLLVHLNRGVFVRLTDKQRVFELLLLREDDELSVCARAHGHHYGNVRRVGFRTTRLPGARTPRCGDTWRGGAGPVATVVQGFARCAAARVARGLVIGKLSDDEREHAVALPARGATVSQTSCPCPIVMLCAQKATATPRSPRSSPWARIPSSRWNARFVRKRRLQGRSTTSAWVRARKILTT